jgi:abhydrolase domain-containing protein 11
MASDLIQFMDDQDMDKSLLIGHSMGGRAVFQFSFLFPERIEKLVAVDVSPTSFPNQLVAMSKYVDAMRQAVAQTSSSLKLVEARKKVDKLLEPTVADKFVRQFLLMNLVKVEKGVIGWNYHLQALKEMLEKGYIGQFVAKTPFPGEALFIYGGRSDYIRDEDMPNIRELFPNSRFHRIPRGSHYLHIERQQEFLEALLPFLRPLDHE